MIDPFREEFCDIVPSKPDYVKKVELSYAWSEVPVPPRFTRRIGGSVEASSNSVLVLKREGLFEKFF